MSLDQLDELHSQLSAEAEARKAVADTLEQWNAVNLLGDAARHVWSAVAWLRQHDMKYPEHTP